jgi:hypothetical protein
MPFDTKPPEKLDKDTLISVFVILSSIKEALGNNLTNNELIKVYPAEQKLHYPGSLPISAAAGRDAEKSKMDILKYLSLQGAIEEVVFLNHAKDHDFWVNLRPVRFKKFYNKVVSLLTLPQSEAINSPIRLVYDSDMFLVRDKTNVKPDMQIKSRQHRFLMSQLWAAKNHEAEIDDLEKQFALLGIKLPSDIDLKTYEPDITVTEERFMKSSSNKLKLKIDNWFGIESSILYDNVSKTYKLNKQYFL